MPQIDRTSAAREITAVAFAPEEQRRVDQYLKRSPASLANALNPGDRGSDIEGDVDFARNEIMSLILAFVAASARQIVDKNDVDLLNEMELGTTEAAAELPLDDYGNPMPSHVPTRNIAKATVFRSTFPKIIAGMSGMLWINGLTRPGDLILERIRPEPDINSLAGNQKPGFDDSIGFVTRLQRAISFYLGRSFSTGLATANKRRKAKQFAALKLGEFRHMLGSLLREKMLLISERDRQRNYENISEELLLGYTLRSVFAQESRESHKARDGWKFYRDNRPGSALPWEDRLVPPYEWNCLCFTESIWDQKGHVTWEVIPSLKGTHTLRAADVGSLMRIRGKWRRVEQRDVGTTLSKSAPMLLARDVKRYRDWFDQQSTLAKTKLIGERHMFALQSTGVFNPGYAHFVDIDGRFVGPVILGMESVAERAARLDRVNELIDSVPKFKNRKLPADQERDFRQEIRSRVN